MSPYPIEKKLVVGISSTALFDLKYEDDLFNKKDLKAYRRYQLENRFKTLEEGVAFPFIRRLLDINKVYKDDSPVEVVLLSKNSPETGLRIMHSIKKHDLDITRAAFTSGVSPHNYIPSFNISLFLSTNESDVRNAIENNYPAGRILPNKVVDNKNDPELRVAFDFDGVIIDHESENVYRNSTLDEYHKHEIKNVKIPHKPGPIHNFFLLLARFQKLERIRLKDNPDQDKILHTSIITARNAPAHERAILTLQKMRIMVDSMFLLGGIEKRRVLEVLKPHIYFDDQEIHLPEDIKDIPLVHIPIKEDISNKKSGTMKTPMNNIMQWGKILYGKIARVKNR